MNDDFDKILKNYQNWSVFFCKYLSLVFFFLVAIFKYILFKNICFIYY